MNRDDDLVITVDLCVMVTMRKGHFAPPLVEHAIREALSRKVKGANADGRCTLHGVETFIEGEPVNLPSGGIAVLNWETFDPNSLTLVPK